MALNVARKLIQAHLLEGEMKAGSEMALKVDQVLLQDVLGILAMLEFEAMGIERVKVDTAVPVCRTITWCRLITYYADGHLFLRKRTRRFGSLVQPAWKRDQSPRSHAAIGKPGVLLVGSDSHGRGGLAPHARLWRWRA